MKLEITRPPIKEKLTTKEKIETTVCNELIAALDLITDGPLVLDEGVFRLKAGGETHYVIIDIRYVETH